MNRRRPIPREWREEHHWLDLHVRRQHDFRGNPQRSKKAGGVCSCGARFGTRDEPARHNMNGADVRDAWLDHVEVAYYEHRNARASATKAQREALVYLASLAQETYPANQLMVLYEARAAREHKALGFGWEFRPGTDKRHAWRRTSGRVMGQMAKAGLVHVVGWDRYTQRYALTDLGREEANG